MTRRDARPANTLRGAPLVRAGGKGLHGHLLLPHFARAKSYGEPFFGAGGMFFRIPPGTYHHEVVNDLENDLIIFFKVLRVRPERLVQVLSATPFARREFLATLQPLPPDHPDPELEIARRVWIRSRQGFAGITTTKGTWGRSPTMASSGPRAADAKLQQLHAFAARLRTVAIDAIDAVEFVARWGVADTMLYADPPYLPATRTGGRLYQHEMTEDDHRRLATALHTAVTRGCKVAVSGYASPLYDRELFKGWRRITFDVALRSTRYATGKRRTEVLWCSYPARDELGDAVLARAA